MMNHTVHCSGVKPHICSSLLPASTDHSACVTTPLLTSGHRSGVSSDGHRSVVSRRCERGRVPSDSSSGISDDSSSNSSGSDRDSGIETGDTGAAGLGSWPGINTTGVPVTFGLDHDERSLDSEDREKIRETLEIGVRKLNLAGKHKNQGERT